MQGQGLFQSFFQAACCTGVDLLQFTLDLLQATFGLRVAQQIIGVRQLAVPLGLLLVGEVLTDVPPLQSRALARRPQERGFRFPEAFATTPVSQSAP